MKKICIIAVLLLTIVPSVVFAELMPVPGVFVQHSGDCWDISMSIQYDCYQLLIIVEGHNKHTGHLQPYITLTPVNGGDPIVIDQPFPLTTTTYPPPATYVNPIFLTDWHGGEYLVTGWIEGWADGQMWSQFIISGTTDGYTVGGKFPPFVVPQDPVVFDLVCGQAPGTGTPGYWKNHPEAWPRDTIIIGGVPYTKDQAIYWMNQPDNKDKTITMFAALVAATLNVAIGNESGCVDDTIVAANEWMSVYGPVGSGVKAGGKTSPWRVGEPLSMTLDEYNNGFLCAESRDALESVGKLAQDADGAPEVLPSVQNYPNPFNPVTTIAFTLPQSEKATLTVYNILGEKIATLADGHFSAGEHAITWNASEFASGIYFYRFEAGSFAVTNKLLFAK